MPPQRRVRGRGWGRVRVRSDSDVTTISLRLDQISNNPRPSHPTLIASPDVPTARSPLTRRPTIRGAQLAEANQEVRMCV